MKEVVSIFRVAPQLEDMEFDTNFEKFLSSTPHVEKIGGLVDTNLHGHFLVQKYVWKVKQIDISGLCLLDYLNLALLFKSSLTHLII